MKKIKITIVTGTRAEYGLLRPILFELKKRKMFNVYLIVTGTHLSKKHGMTINEIEKDGFKIYSKFTWDIQNDSLENSAIMLGKSIINLAKIFKKINPDYNLIFGDRSEMLSSAIAGTYLNIANIHVHGGDISEGIDEYNRHAITKLSNLHFPATTKSKNRIIQLGENPKNVFMFGSTSIDDLKNYTLPNKKQLEKKYNIKINKNTIVLLQHPVTTQTTLTNKHFAQTLLAIKKLKLNTIAISPNTDPSYKQIFNSLEKFSKKYSWFKLIPSLPRLDFLGLVKNSGVLIGNSSSGLIEISYLQIPVVNIGDRQKNRERGNNVIDAKTSSISIQNAIKTALSDFEPKKTSIFGNGNTSKKIVDIISKTKYSKHLSAKKFFEN